MKDNFEELKCLLQHYNKKEHLKIAMLAVVCVLAIVGIAAAAVYFIKGGCCCSDDFCDFDDDDFDFDDDDDDFDDEE